MASPRSETSLIGATTEDRVTRVADGTTITYDATQPGGSAAVNKAVTLTATDDIVALVADADYVLGKLLLVEPDLRCTIQVTGAVTLPAGNGATVTRGTPIVGALGAASAKGYIRNAAASTAELIKANGHIQEIADTANVVVLF